MKFKNEITFEHENNCFQCRIRSAPRVSSAVVVAISFAPAIAFDWLFTLCPLVPSALVHSSHHRCRLSRIDVAIVFR